MPTNVTAGDALVEAVGRNSYEDCLCALGEGTLTLCCGCHSGRK